MVTVSTPDGIEYIFSNADAIELIEKYISYDFSRYISDRIAEVDTDKYRAEQEFMSDYHAMEMESEELRNELYEIKSQLEQLSYNADTPGMSKKKVIAEIDKMWDHIQSIL